MFFKELMTNLLIGIVGGAYSSAIVSRVLLIIESYQAQLLDLRQRLLPLYGITAILMLKQEGTTSEGAEIIEDLLKKQITEAQKNFSDNMPEDYQHDMRELYCSALGFRQNHCCMSSIANENTLQDIKDKNDAVLNQLESVNRKFKHNYFAWCLKDKTLRILGIIGILVILLCFISMLIP